MGSVMSKTNEDNTNRVTNITINCFNGSKNDKDKTKSVNGPKKVKSEWKKNYRKNICEKDESQVFIEFRNILYINSFRHF